jgi:hypothetical protein
MAKTEACKDAAGTKRQLGEALARTMAAEAQVEELRRKMQEQVSGWYPLASSLSTALLKLCSRDFASCLIAPFAPTPPSTLLAELRSEGRLRAAGR